MLTARDVKFLTACGIAADEENFRLETLWRNWQRANLHRDFSPCRDCGAKTYKQHALDCKHGAAMVFVDSTQDKTIKALAKRIAKHRAPIQVVVTPFDGTSRILAAHGIPITRETYLQLAFAGHPPAEPFDGELLAELPPQLFGRRPRRRRTRKNLTTEQLAEQVLDDVRSMTPEEKAEIRKHLDQQLKSNPNEEKSHD
jgi:hypothetical protein